MKIVTSGTSSRLRKKALQDPSYTLANMLIDGRKYETSSAQAEGIEEQFIHTCIYIFFCRRLFYLIRFFFLLRIL